MSKEQSGTEQKKSSGKPKKSLLELVQETSDSVEITSRIVSNYYSYMVDDEERKAPQEADAIWDSVKAFIGDKICRVGPRLFAIIDQGETVWIDSVSEYFSMLFRLGMRGQWTDKLSGAVTKSEFYAFAKTKAQNFDFIMDYPLYPPMENVFYKHMVEPKSTGKLDALLEFFNPASETDRLLLKAAFVTVFWGKSAGKKPAFVFDGEEDAEDKNGKRGIGKSAIIEAMAKLIGEKYVDMSYKADVEDMKKQLLGAQGRIVRFDNVKAGVLNSEALESLITAETISGHRMYVGQSDMPNLFTYCFTFNDAALSKDMAQRSVVIKIKRPTYSADWEDGLNAFIEANRSELIADIGWILNKPINANATIQTRFSRWERQVLQKVTEKDLGSYVKGCQDSVDDEINLVNDIRELIENKIAEYMDPHDSKVPINPEESVVAIKTTVLHAWLKELLGRGYAERHIKKKLMAYRPDEIEKDVAKIDGVRFYVWTKQASRARNSAYKISSEIRVSNLAAVWMRGKGGRAQNQEADENVRALHISELM